jgi:hypothetical protein
MATSSPPSPSTGNLLERILLNVHGDRCIPKESGVHFTVGRASDFRGILLVFKVDDDDVAGTEIRPDWLVVCATEDCLRLTLIEMKGREGKNTKHGVEQLETFWRRLKQACDAVLPSRLRGRGRFEIQGILLTPPNSDVPRERIAALSRQGFEIQHVGAARRVDLGPLVTAPINRRLHFRPPLGLPFELTALEGRLRRRFVTRGPAASLDEQPWCRQMSGSSCPTHSPTGTSAVRTSRCWFPGRKRCFMFLPGTTRRRSPRAWPTNSCPRRFRPAQHRATDREDRLSPISYLTALRITPENGSLALHALELCLE